MSPSVSSSPQATHEAPSAQAAGSASPAGPTSPEVVSSIDEAIEVDDHPDPDFMNLRSKWVDHSRLHHPPSNRMFRRAVRLLKLLRSLPH